MRYKGCWFFSSCGGMRRIELEPWTQLVKVWITGFWGSTLVYVAKHWNEFFSFALAKSLRHRVIYLYQSQGFLNWWWIRTIHRGEPSSRIERQSQRKLFFTVTFQLKHCYIDIQLIIKKRSDRAWKWIYRRCIGENAGYTSCRSVTNL